MKKILVSLLIILPIFILLNLYFLDKDYFLCPIEYQQDMAIRYDGRGDGHFGAVRKGGRRHEGLDLLASVGTPVLASRSGRVVAARGISGMGKYVIIRHSGNITTLYGHLSKIYVTKGQFVRQGKVIGAVGKTGNAKYKGIQPHLHFEVRNAGKPQDPLEYLP